MSTLQVCFAMKIKPICFTSLSSKIQCGANLTHALHVAGKLWKYADNVSAYFHAQVFSSMNVLRVSFENVILSLYVN